MSLGDVNPIICTYTYLHIYNFCWGTWTGSSPLRSREKTTLPSSNPPPSCEKKTLSIPSHLVFRYISLYILIGKWWFARPLPNMTKQCTISSSPRSHNETCVSFHYILSGRMGWFNQNQLKIPFLKLRQPLKMGRVLWEISSSNHGFSEVMAAMLVSGSGKRQSSNKWNRQTPDLKHITFPS